MIDSIDTQSLGTAIVTIGAVLAAIRAQTIRIERGQRRIWQVLDEQKNLLSEHDRRILKIELRRELKAEMHTERPATRSKSNAHSQS